MSLVAFFEIFISLIEIFFTYFSIKFYNLHLKWNILRISLWKWKKWILFYERSSSNIILIKNTKLFFLLGVCIYITYQIKKCVYICMCVCVCVCGSCLNKYISAATWPSQTKILGSTPGMKTPKHNI